MDDNGDLEGLIQYHKYLEYGDDAEEDGLIDLVNDNGAKALQVYREWRANANQGSVSLGAVFLSVAAEEYCPSSNKMGHQSGLSIGGSGSFV